MNKRSIAAFHKRLHGWYAKHGRCELPWRNNATAYEVYISEVMLQQTQVATVLERYYFPFLKRFPTLAALADAPQQDVLKAWEGLGYYTRARNLHKAANIAGGVLPNTSEALLKLPGIGKNTAHAILAFGYGKPYPVMEANLKRVLSRIFALTQPKDDALWEMAWQLLDTNAPFDYNQAMMDIGATICTKKSPQCSECPANTVCIGKAKPLAYPAPKQPKKNPVRKKNIVIYVNQKQEYYFTPRSTAFLGGLYGFAEYDAKKGESTISLGRKSFNLTQGKYLGDVKQIYSHFTLQAEVYLLRITASGKDWKPLCELAALPKSKADEKCLKLLYAHHQDLESMNTPC